MVIHIHACIKRACMSEMYVHNSQFLPDKCLEAAPCPYKQEYPAPSNWFLIATVLKETATRV